jgi:glucose-1-phosphate thymidylyltransferase
LITKGIILAGGKGTRLSPLTKVTNKQLLPIYDKPMIFYPLSILMLAGIKNILIIVNKGQVKNFFNVLGNGERFGIKIQYKVQNKPKGIADAFILGRSFIKKDNVCLILGDNFFYGQSLTNKLLKAKNHSNGATIFLITT